MAIDFEKELNSEQWRAVRHVEGPVLILAGAGSGKTRTITYKIAYLIQNGFARPDQILAVTFTNKAAAEMRTRVQELVGGSMYAPLISTFHSFGVRLLRRHAGLLDLRTDFAICDVDDQKRLIKQLYRERELKDEDVPLEKTRGMISRSKNRGWSPEDFLRESRDFDAEILYELYKGYQELIRRSNGVDFDDLLILSVQLFRDNPELCRRYGDTFRYLLIDEYQDTNPPQYEMIRLMTVTHQNLSAVGDEDQAIYGFRGADITNILRFEADFPGAVVIKLEQNYRSCQTILSAATAVVSNNLNRKDKVLWTELPKGEPITVFVAEDAGTEAAFVAQQTYLHRQDGIRSIAVLYRTNFQSRQFEEAFRRLSIPYKLVGGVSFYHRREVRDATAYLRVVLNPGDDVSLGRILNEPPRRIGERTRSRLLRMSSDHSIPIWEAILKSLADQEFPARTHRALQDFADLVEACREMRDLPLHLAMEKILKKVGYFRWLEEDGSEEASNRILNLKELMNVAREYEGAESWQQFLDEAALHTELDDVDETADVTLMTLHNAKGLEFPVVFLAGCEEGLFPHSRSIAENDLEEERRLCYVGLTRARRRLYLSYSRHRRFFGRDSNEINQPSRFLHEIPTELIENRYSAGFHGSRSFAAPVHLQASSLSVPAKPKSNFSGRTYNSPESIKQALANRTSKKSSGGLQKGTLIVHERFGKGQVLDVESTGDDLKVTVRFPGLGVKKLLQSYAKLKPA